VTHQVIIRRTRRSAKRQYYEAILDGAVIVSKSADPVHAACRAMKAKGLAGRVEFFRPGDPYPSLIVHDLDKAAMLRVVETEQEGPVRKKWRPFEVNGRCRNQA
jgi:beta-lactamase regulating signal transducer with metallopeptidase domain